MPGGKLLRVKIEADDTSGPGAAQSGATIHAVHISGDFFLHPEDALPAIEKSLGGLPVNSTAQGLAQKIHEALAAQKAAFLGVSAEDIAQTIVEALAAKP